MEEHQTVVLTRDDPDSGLKRGDIGAVVHIYAGGDAHEVEFVSGDGKTIALLTLGKNDIRPIGNREILHVREMAPA